MTPNRRLHHCPLNRVPLPSASRFRVEVGHWRLDIEAADRVEAIRIARKELCRQLPRLWDAIHSLPDEKFRVTASEAETARGAAAPSLRLHSA